ncbi:hypothetical protein [Proteocatella sphenisci]|uniref:hypothetical protein n=1 Tax=Proteocatella sphenisci TaxID=181070 RepID=UPI0004B80013|nr:hypothetical protein [Proteocatella sphenisci]
MGKRNLSEEDIKDRYITHAIIDSGLDIKKQVHLDMHLLMEEFYMMEKPKKYVVKN